MISKSEILQQLKGKCKKEEVYFRFLVAHIIYSDIAILCDKKKFCEFLIVVGEDDSSELFNWLLIRRDELVKETKDAILRQLTIC